MLDNEFLFILSLFFLFTPCVSLAVYISFSSVGHLALPISSLSAVRSLQYCLLLHCFVLLHCSVQIHCHTTGYLRMKRKKSQKRQQDNRERISVFVAANRPTTTLAMSMSREWKKVAGINVCYVIVIHMAFLFDKHSDVYPATEDYGTSCVDSIVIMPCHFSKYLFAFTSTKSLSYQTQLWHIHNNFRLLHLFFRSSPLHCENETWATRTQKGNNGETKKYTEYLYMWFM